MLTSKPEFRSREFFSLHRSNGGMPDKFTIGLRAYYFRKNNLLKFALAMDGVGEEAGVDEVGSPLDSVSEPTCSVSRSSMVRLCSFSSSLKRISSIFLFCAFERSGRDFLGLICVPSGSARILSCAALM